MQLRCELHCHSWYSADCHVSPEHIAEICERQKIDVLALTDHNEILGALELKKLTTNTRIIIGEEVKTKQGELIALFIKERIRPWLEIQETIRLIRDQGGLILVPHPFDRIRSNAAVGKTVLEKIKNKVDFIEIFNARALISVDNKRAQEFANEEQLPGFVGSDAHTPAEYGMALNLIGDFSTAKEFAEQLRHAEFLTKRSGILAHLRSHVSKFQHRIKPMRRK